jgi:type II secretory pathway predicted ATPase ExeA
MYYAHWGLSHSPFASATPLFYRGESQAEALARLRYAAEESRYALLVGERGVGKSALLAEFAAERRQAVSHAALVSLAGRSPRELLWELAAGLSLGPRPEDDAVRLFRRLEDFAAAAVWQRAPALVLLDDANLVGPDSRWQLARLFSLGGHAGRWATFILAGDQRLPQLLGEDVLGWFELRVDLEPWSEADMVGYIQHALVAAGREEPAFDEEALGVMYTLTGGAPRQVNRLADHALLGAAAEECALVGAAMIEAAHEALGWTASRPG